MKTFRLYAMGIAVLFSALSCNKSELTTSLTSSSSESTSNYIATLQPATYGCGSHCTYTQGGYGAPNGQPHDFMYANFRKAFPNGFSVGSRDCTNGHVVFMGSPKAVTNSLPAGGKPAALTTDYKNTVPKNVLVGQLITLCLNIGMEKYDPKFTSATTPLKNMMIGSGPFEGWTVNAFFIEANKVLGGCSTSYTPSQVNETATSINENYDMDDNNSQDNGFLNCP